MKLIFLGDIPTTSVTLRLLASLLERNELLEAQMAHYRMRLKAINPIIYNNLETENNDIQSIS